MSLVQVTVWAERDSPRLRYVLDWLFTERLGLSYQLTTNRQEAATASNCLAYGYLQEHPSIAAGTLLWEQNALLQHEIICEEWQGLYTLFLDRTSPCDIQFDLLSGIFFLLTRYEEYLPFAPDKHQRFPATHSILFPALERPVVDEWVEAVRVFLEKAWNTSIPIQPFRYQPSYDIDIAWSYKFKGSKRMLGAAVKELLGGKLSKLSLRLRVLKEQEEDPYYSFVYLFHEHMMDAVRPIYFVLAALQSSAFDKNISPKHPRMAALIKAISGNALLGLHPSYYSDAQPDRFLEEKAVLEEASGSAITQSRQHFIKLRFPETYRSLMAAGITDDWSMGYSTHFGFRAGTSHSFLWYDLQAEQATALRVQPFAFMDSTGHYDLGLSAEEAFHQLRVLTDRLRACGGQLVTIMHNYSLGTDPEWKGWREQYSQFLADLKATGNQAEA